MSFEFEDDQEVFASSYTWASFHCNDMLQGDWFCSSWRFWSTSVLVQGVFHTIWLMTAAGSATAGPVLDRR